MEVEWDPGKQRANLKKHGVEFADAVAVLEDERGFFLREPFSDDEERWIAVGMDALGRVLFVVYVWRGEKIRLISARHATPAERQRYAEGL